MGEPRPARRTLALALVALLALQPTLIAPGAGASAATEIMGATLPSPRDGTAAVTLNGHIYVFGGDTGTRSDQIVRYDPIADQAVVMGATLPSARSGMGAVAADGLAYLFGGWDGATYSAQIVRYDPSTDTATTMSAQLPSGRTYTSAVWDGTHAYVFGGGTACSPCTTDQIVRYDPATDTVTVMAATLPERRYGTSAIWDGTHAYIFGGVTASTSTEHADIVRYDPSTDTTAVLPATLPDPRYHSAAAYLDGRAFIIGGYPCTDWPHYCDTIVSFDPDSGTVTTETTRLNTARYLTSVAVRGDHIYIIGGYDGARTGQILRYGPDAAPPPRNHAPRLDPIADLAVITGDNATRHVHATDPDGDNLTLAITGLPSGATFTDHGDGTGTLTWPTGPGDEGTHTLTARADDGHILTTRSFTIYVDDDPPPVLAHIPDHTIIEGAHLTVTATASDPAQQAITLTASGLPTNATFTDHGDGTATFDWPTTYTDSGTHDIQVHASDGAATDTETFRVTVLPFDRPPVFDPLPATDALAGSLHVLAVHADDPDGDPITLRATQLPPGASFTDLGNGHGRLEWTPQNAQIGSHTARLVATTDTAETSATAKIHVLPAYAFTLYSTSFGFLHAKPGETITMDGRLTNTGYHNDTYTFTGRDAASTPQGWTVTAPDPITLAAGASTTVTLTATVPPHGTYGKPRLVATSSGDPALSRMLTSVVEVPVRLDIQLDDPAPTVAGLGLLSITGTVTATWWDGTPVVGQSVHVTNSPEQVARLGTERTGTTDATGTLVLDYTLDPIAALPGEHVLVAKLTRNGRTDTDTAHYHVRPA